MVLVLELALFTLLILGGTLGYEMMDISIRIIDKRKRNYIRRELEDINKELGNG